jgi:Mg-chelatase subunit ChlD
VYVLDISASMLNRLAKARAELRAAMATLQPSETFDIVAFFGDIRVFRGAQVAATPENIAAAGVFLDGLDFEEGTNFEKALLSALGRRGVNLVVLITDGVPTVGQTKWKKLTKEIREANRSRARIFTIGLVGQDPQGKDRSFEAKRLLQQISGDSGGQSKLFPLG